MAHKCITVTVWYGVVWYDMVGYVLRITGAVRGVMQSTYSPLYLTTHITEALVIQTAKQ